MHWFVFNPEEVIPQTTTLMLEKGEKLSFWNSLDVTYKSPVNLQFTFQLTPKRRLQLRFYVMH